MHSLLFLSVAAALAFSTSGLVDPGPVSASVATDVDSYPFAAPQSGPGLSLKKWTGVSLNKTYTGHLATVTDPRFFRFEVSPGGLPHLSKTSVTSVQRNCTYATNGGFFDMSTGAAEGNLIVNSTVLASFDSARANVGFTDDAVVFGYLAQGDVTVAGPYKWSHLMAGAGWVVRKGASYTAAAVANGEVSLAFAQEMAPRTALGVTAKGALLLLVVDGEEDIKAGADLYQMSDIMLSLGAVSAVNFDGGGSTVAVYEGEWVSSPTCTDTHVLCERAVSSITCIAM